MLWKKKKQYKYRLVITVPGTLILKMWALGDSSQSIKAVDPDQSRKTGGLRKKRLKGYPKIASAMAVLITSSASRLIGLFWNKWGLINDLGEFMSKCEELQNVLRDLSLEIWSFGEDEGIVICYDELYWIKCTPYYHGRSTVWK